MGLGRARAISIGLGIGLIVFACVGKDPDALQTTSSTSTTSTSSSTGGSSSSGDGSTSSSGGSSGGSSGTTTSSTSTSSSSGGDSGTGACPSVPHNCSAPPATDTCTVLSAAVVGSPVLHFDACTHSTVAGQRITELATTAGGATGAGTVCGSGTINGGTSIFFPEGGDGFQLDPSFQLGDNFAIFVVAIPHGGSGASNQVLVQRATAIVPYIGPAILAQYAYAVDSWNGADPTPSLVGTTWIGGQMKFGAANSDAGYNADVVAYKTPSECVPHVFRLSRAGSSFELAVDTKLVSTGTTTEAVAGSALYIGNSSGKGQAFKGEIGEVLVYLNPPNIAAVENALAMRWKIPKQN